MTGEALNNYLNQLGVDTKLRPKDTRNVASVMITAKIPSWAKVGDKIDVTVSSIGDARSLENGVLLQSPLKAGNGQIVAVASGSLQGSANSSDSGRKSYSKKNSPKNTTSILGGAIVEKEIASQPKKILSDTDDLGTQISIPERERIRIQLVYPSYSTLNSILEILNETFSQEELNTKVLSQREFEITVPTNRETIGFLAELEDLKVEPEIPARVVINEQTGTIVFGGNLAMDEVAVSKQGLQVRLESKGKSRYFWTDTNDKSESVFLIKKANNVQTLVEELNRMGASTKDIISILQGLKKSGVLHAEVMIQ
jgi:flagellar P-ring protein precursor FlgI